MDMVQMAAMLTAMKIRLYRKYSIPFYYKRLRSACRSDWPFPYHCSLKLYYGLYFIA
jgi:hypothetical protein